MLLCYIKSTQVTPTRPSVYTGFCKTRASDIPREIMRCFLRENGRPIEAKKTNDQRFLPPPLPCRELYPNRPCAAQRKTDERIVSVRTSRNDYTVQRVERSSGRDSCRVPRKRENKRDSI